MSIKVIVAGFKGRMGSTAVEMVKGDDELTLAALLDPFAAEKEVDGVPVFTDKADLVGFDAIMNMQHPSFAQALETAMVCEIPFDILDDLSGKMPKLRQQIMRLMSNEIKSDQEMILLLSKMNAEERLAAFIYNLSQRYSARGFSAREFRLTMTRGDIGNYLGLTVETISRLLGRFQKLGILSVQGKYITINNMAELIELSGTNKTKIKIVI